MLLFKAVFICLIPVVFSGGGGDSMGPFVPYPDTSDPGAMNYGACNGKVEYVLTYLPADSTIECGVQCHATSSCVAFSYRPSLAYGCVLSDFFSTVPEAGWITMVQKSLQHLC